MKELRLEGKRPKLVRWILFLSIVLNFGAVFRSLSIENEAGDSISREDLSFLPPKPNPAAKKKRRRTTTTTVTRNGRVVVEALPHNFTHFLSHIPKTGAEYAAQDLARLLFATVPLPGNKSLYSIIEAQSRYNHSLQKQSDYDSKDPEWLYFNKNSRNHDHENPDSDAYAPLMICNHATVPFKYWSPFHFGRRNTIKFRCNMVVAELLHRGDVPNAYTIVREPVSHVVSQYFHCSDSTKHKSKHLMPPMEEWLDAYTNLTTLLPTGNRLPYGNGLWGSVKEARKLRKKFNCYNPIDTESLFVRFPAEDKNGERLVLPKDYVYPYPFDESLPRDEETRELDRQLFNDLKNRFRIIGDTSRMIKTVCSIFIDMTNGEYIPKPCDCTHWDEVNKTQYSSTPTFHVPNLYQQDVTQGAGSKLWIMHPYLQLGYNPQKHAHGVSVRGSEFVKKGLAPSQKTQITKKLRPLDLVLYNISRAVFDAQTAELESAYGIKICEESFNREGEIIVEEEDNSKQ